MYIVALDPDKCKGREDCINACPSPMLALVEKDGEKYAMLGRLIKRLYLCENKSH